MSAAQSAEAAEAPANGAEQPGTLAGPGTMDISPYLKLMVQKGGSDLFFTSGAPVKIKLEGKVQSVGKSVLTPELSEAAANGIMNDAQRKEFGETMECDFAIGLPDGSARFRVNVFRQRGHVGMVLRLIPSEIPSIEDLNVPEVLKDLITAKRGLLLMVGATGSGKSTTLAAMINHRNGNMAGHILTIEDPVEFYHPNRKSIINQREVGVDTMSYARALKASLREAPDVILIGEIRDRVTMEAALELANTGHLAISTMHANNANQAMERVINMFPQELHKQLYMDLSLNLRAVVSQRLVPDVRGKRCAAVEILVNTPHIQELILKGEIEAIKEAMTDSGAKGMQTFDMSLYNLYKENRITLEEALNNADSRTNLEAKINFG
ncbi:MAG: PilT/PilU family type 4a pilus ATPase [Pseudomonadota bacterium]